MNTHFIVSLIQNGLLGGSVTAEAEALIYRTGKMTVPREYRHLVMKYAQIRKMTTGRLFILPTVSIEMENGTEYRFAVFFGRTRLVNILREMGAAQ